MKGPTILARSMSTATRRGQDAVAWQYHSRSDSHSKVACWAVLFDLLCECDTKDFGFDVVGTTVVECRNDGSPVTVMSGPPAPQISDHHHYERMIRAICAEYRSRFHQSA